MPLRTHGAVDPVFNRNRNFIYAGECRTCDARAINAERSDEQRTRARGHGWCAPPSLFDIFFMACRFRVWRQLLPDQVLCPQMKLTRLPSRAHLLHLDGLNSTRNDLSSISRTRLAASSGLIQSSRRSPRSLNLSLVFKTSISNMSTMHGATSPSSRILR